MPEEAQKQSVRSKFSFYILAFLGILLFAGGAVMSGLVIKEQPQVLGLSAQTEMSALISQIGKLIVLPSNESPIITTVGDASKLNDQPFFRNAKNNDKLLVYTNMKWAVLYRPSENRIIEVGAFSLTTPSPSPTDSPSPTPSPSSSPTPSPSSTPTESPSPTPTASPTL